MFRNSIYAYLDHATMVNNLKKKLDVYTAEGC